MADNNTENEEMVDEDFEINDDDFLDTDESSFFTAEEKSAIANSERRARQAAAAERRRQAAVEDSSQTPEPPSRNLTDITEQTRQYLSQQEEDYNSRVVPWYDNDPSYDPDFEAQFQSDQQMAQQYADVQNLELSLDSPYQDPDSYTPQPLPEEVASQYAINPSDPEGPRTDFALGISPENVADREEISQEEYERRIAASGGASLSVTDPRPEISERRGPPSAPERMEVTAEQYEAILRDQMETQALQQGSLQAGVQLPRVEDEKDPRFAQILKEIKDKSCIVINLNPIMKEDLLKNNEKIFGAKFRVAFVDDIKDSAEKKGIIRPEKARRFVDFEKASIKSVTPTFEFNEESLHSDMESGTKVLTNGNSFKRDLNKLKQDFQALNIQNFGDLYQISLVVDAETAKLKDLVLFHYQKSEDDSFSEVVRRLPPPSMLAALKKRMSANSLRYMAELSEIAKAYSASAAKTLMSARSCANTIQLAKVKARYHDYLDYLKFSRQFQTPHMTLPGGTQIEKNKLAAEETFWSASNFKKITKDFVGNLQTNVDNATGRLVDYTVNENDKIEYGVDPNSGEASYVIVGKPDGSSPLANLALSSAGPFKSAITAENILKDNENLSSEFSRNFAENKNALRAGMVIKIARQSNASFDFGSIFQESSGKDKADIFKEAFLDPFLKKLCPATIPERLFECLYPSDCRELIKYIGLWRTRDILENFVNLDIFDDRNGLLDAMEEWDATVQNYYNFKATSFSGNGLLKSGQFDGKLLFPKGSDKISVSMQLKTTTAANAINQIPNQREINEGKEKYIFSVPGTFSILKDVAGGIVIEIVSEDGRTARYRTKDGTEDVFDGKFHQIGFSWTGPVGELVIVIDGVILPTQRYTNFGFRGPLSVSSSSQVVFSSLSPNKSSKGFAGQVDEVCIFNDVLIPDQWKKLANITSVGNIQTDGMLSDATAWWRMGDSIDDRLETQGGRRPNAKIKDLVSSIDVSPIPGSSPEDQKIVVVRDFRVQDEDRFIDIINRNTNITKFCNQLLDWIKELINVNFDFEKIKEDFSQWVTPRNYPKDPQFDIKLFINGAIIDNVISLFATTLLRIAEQYLLNCDNWKSLLQAATRGTVNMNTESFQAAFAQMGDQSPLTDFINNYDDPDYWDRAVFSSDSITANFTRQLESMALSSVGVSYGDNRAPATLNFGSIISTPSRSGAQDPNRGDRTSNQGPQPLPWQQGTQILIEDESRSNLDRTTTIYIIQDTMSQLQPPQVLELFSGNASPETLEEVQAIVRENFTDSQDVVNVNSISTLFGTVGSSMGLQNSIDQLINASQQLAATLPSIGSFCGPSRSFRERLGLPSNRADAIDAIREMLDFADMKFPEGPCSLPIPLTEFEKNALNSTIGSAYSSVLQAYDSDLVLHRLGMTSIGQTSKTIPKVLWKGENIRKKVTNQDYLLGLCPMPGSSDTNGELFEWKDVKIEKTTINPEFETAIRQGYIPLKEDGTVDGTPDGGVTETDWNPFGGNFLQEKRPPREVKEGEDVRNLGPGKALGPYTDYENPDAIINEVRIDLGGDLANALSGEAASFALQPGNTDGQRPRYDTSRESEYSQRGLFDIVSKNRASLLGTSLYPGGENISFLADSLTDVWIQTRYGTSLSGVKYLNFEKKITDPNSWSAETEFSLAMDLQEAIVQSGYDETPTVCDDQGNVVAARQEPFTPQENVFGHIVQQQNENIDISEEDLKIQVYDGIYREVLTSIMFKVADSPLLKPVPNSQGPNNEPLLGINFVNFQTNPRLIDMRSFADQVAEDYEALLGCQDTLAEEPIYKALKSSISRMLARICIVELVMRGVVPFSQLFLSKKDPIIKNLLMEKLREDMQLFLTPSQQSGVKAKIVKEFNYLANTAAIEAPPVNESLFESEWERAMSYYFEEEFDAVVNRLKEMIHGECIPKQGENEGDIDNRMYQAVLKYAKEKGLNLKLETYAVNSEGLRIDGFDFSSPSNEVPGARIVTALVYLFNNRKISLTSTSKSYAELREELGLDDDSLECTQNSRYDLEGSTTTESNHFHTYSIDEFGNGVTVATHPAPGVDPESIEAHDHAIASYAVVPRVLETGEIAHIHSLVQRAEESEIRRASDRERIEESMSGQLIGDPNFKILFDFCFDLREVSSFVLIYCILSSENQISYRAFSNTKKAILQMYNWLWQEGPAAAPCDTGVQKEYSPDLSSLFPNLADAFLNPQLLLSLLLAPLMTYRGWTKTADPHVFITTTVMDTLDMPICPVWEKRNVPDPRDNNKIKCMDIPTWPGTRPLDNLYMNTNIPSFAVEWGVAGIVTLAPTLVGLPPFTPTPFGAVYYGAVAPLIWIMRDLPRLQLLIQNNALAQQSLESIGLNVGPVSCDLPTETGADSQESESQEDCPDIKTLDDTILDISSAECQD